MLQPIRVTDVRLNSVSPVNKEAKTSKEKKRVQFTPASIHPPRSALTEIAQRMDDDRQAKKPRTESRPATPTPKTVKRPKSASTWRRAELENCSVVMKRDVAPSNMIPERFFNFAHLQKFADCLHHPLSHHVADWAR